MNNFDTNNNLIEKAMDAFIQQTAMRISLKETVVKNDIIWDRAVIENQVFDLFLKPSLTSQNLSAVLYELSQKDTQTPLLLVTRYLNPNLVDKLREAGVQFIDSVGNSFIHQPPLHVFIKGNKATEKPISVQSGRAFQYSGLKVIFAFLQNPELIDASYRDIAEHAHVALGSVGGILSDLMAQGYIQQSAKKRILVNKTSLLQRWVEDYPILKQKHYLGTFTTEDDNWWKNIQLAQYEALWGGEIAAQCYTQYLRAKDGVVYIHPKQLSAFVRDARLKKRKTEDEDAIRIELIEPFWRLESEQADSRLAPALLVYADLIHSKDARNLDTAKRLYEQWLN